MPLYTADALVLRTYKLGEADRIVVFLTSDRGKKRGVAKSARRPRSRFAGALEPLTHVRVAYFEKETRELVSLNYAEPVRSPMAGPGEAVHYASYFAELIDEWAPADDPNETLYRLGASVVDAMAHGMSPELLARYFEYLGAAAAGRLPAAPGVPPVRGAVHRTARRGRLVVADRGRAHVLAVRGGTGWPAVGREVVGRRLVVPGARRDRTGRASWPN